MERALGSILIALAIPTLGAGLSLISLDARGPAVFAFWMAGAAIGYATYLLTDR